MKGKSLTQKGRKLRKGFLKKLSFWFSVGRKAIFGYDHINLGKMLDSAGVVKYCIANY